MFFSIVCTAGISLVVWIPGWWLLGTVVSQVFEMVLKQEAKASPPRPMGRRERQICTLANYMKKAHSAGLSVNSIVNNLEQAGWPTDLIRESLEYAKKVPADSTA